ncbi:N-alpha-acetyltransferase, non-catalitic subunit [Coemansia thaxteri]|uniref:N-alpha-acetyltransferase, non-catalitic subunit n=1 Tax=Coemansia thaxteri TaxID=2663907 RepID=A0A9W8BKV4_9FUNG|nr:N-alpha-acetyltransferase, non-catalitic subunit [Coemansia thaxteri]KAJ2007541.1 N-alpha-acetyltransferase, non-catalitic subunit [Coemansia thaxteri]KAJ2472468.1 N-alpha-acetyltransferase, non-catalitic subunit [Coemansia sp. RSA 2322]
MANDELAQQLADRLVVADAEEWVDITALVKTGTERLGSGEMIRLDSLSLFDAMTSVEVMDARLDMGMLTAEDMAEIAQWDISRRLTLRETLWIVDRLFCCEMTWHHSASLLQTIFSCNYYTADSLPAAIGRVEETDNRERDVILYPLVIATGACCRHVWNEYARENVYAEEDVHLGAAGIARFFDEYALGDALRLLDSGAAYLQARSAEGDEEDARVMLLGHMELRRHWLGALASLAAEQLREDPGALARAMGAASALQERHAAFVARHQSHVNSKETSGVAGVFDAKCMRRFPSAAPIKPRDLVDLATAHRTLAQLAADVGLVRRVLALESVEALAHVFQALARRHPPPLPYVRSLLVSALMGDGHVQLAQPLVAFAHRAIAELAGPAASADLRDPRVAEAFGPEAARMLADWFRTHCQNAPRQRRIALKYVAAWDALQADAEQLDIALFSDEERAGSPEHNPFRLSSWAYHMKLGLMELALVSGVRLSVYQAYEYPAVFCYAAQVFEAHAAHLARMARHAAGDLADQQPEATTCLWTRRPVAASHARAQIERWRAAVAAQKELATAVWLAAHACDRLGLVQPPWAQRRTRLSLQVCARQETRDARAARFALRFRAFSRLGSPTPLTFDAWEAAARQLDTHPLRELLAHAARLLADAKRAMDHSRQMFDGAEDYAAHFRALYYVVVANSVALAKLGNDPRVAKSPALAASGADVLELRSALYVDALAQASPIASQAKTKKRDKKSRKHSSSSSQAAATLARAREWQAEVDRLVAAGALRVAWTTAPERHPDWPILSV